MKAVLVIDKMPNSCNCCKFNHFNCHWGCTQRGNKDVSSYMENNTRAEWCPLRPLPQELDNISVLPEDPNNWSFVHYESLGYEEGWNACLYEITGETE